jgi:hypothetical protein
VGLELYYLPDEEELLPGWLLDEVLAGDRLFDELRGERGGPSESGPSEGAVLVTPPETVMEHRGASDGSSLWGAADELAGYRS